VIARRARLLSVLAVIVGGALALISSTQTWLEVTLREGAHPVLSVAGADASALLAPLSLAALALGLALSIVGRILRYALGLLAVAIGGLLAVGALRIAVEHPADAFAAAVTEATGLTGIEAVSALVDAVESTPWPHAALAGAVLVAAGGACTLATAHRWSGSDRRYRQEPSTSAGPTGSRPHDAIDSWDELSRGDDPTA